MIDHKIGYVNKVAINEDVFNQLNSIRWVEVDHIRGHMQKKHIWQCKREVNI